MEAGRGARTGTGTGPGAGQDNEKYFHIANKVISPRLGKPRQGKTGQEQKQALCQAVLTLVKNHEHCQALLPSPALSLCVPAARTHLRAACFCSIPSIFQFAKTAN